MDVLMGLVIVTIILAGGWVGYHSWQHSMEEGYDSGEAHAIGPEQQLVLYDGSHTGIVIASNR